MRYLLLILALAVADLLLSALVIHQGWLPVLYHHDSLAGQLGGLHLQQQQRLTVFVAVFALGLILLRERISLPFQRLFNCGVTLALGGALGNAVALRHWGGVPDFLSFGPLLSSPADVAIFLGWACLIAWLGARAWLGVRG